LFQDSDLSHRLRDLSDIDALLQQYAANSSFWVQLRRQVTRHGLARPCWYSLHFCKLFFGSPIPDEFMKELPGGKPLAPVLFLMNGFVRRALPPADPDRLPALGTRSARAALLVRSVWLRMPFRLLAYHSAMKFLRRLRDRIRPQGSTAQ